MFTCNIEPTLNGTNYTSDGFIGDVLLINSDTVTRNVAEDNVRGGRILI